MKKARLYKLAGILVSTVPAAVATLRYFPLWLGEERSAISLLSVLLLLLCTLSFRRVLREALKTPSPLMCWVMLFLVLTAFENISRGVRAVALIAIPFSLVGAVFFHLARQWEEREANG